MAATEDSSNQAKFDGALKRVPRLLLPDSLDSEVVMQSRTVVLATNIMAYGSTPHVGMTLKKSGGHIKSAPMTRSKRLH